MALSYDNQAAAQKAFEQELNVARALDQAHDLAKKLVLFERNPDPMRHFEAENPAHGVHIRVLRPNLNMRITVDEECRRHNSLVQNLGVEPK